MMSRKHKFIFITLAVLTLSLGLFHIALAQVDLFGGQQSALGSALGLGAQDPRVTAAKIIRAVLGFLGIIAVGLVMYGGWLWMTSAGDASKVEKARKLLISAGIGLLIILSAFGIVSFLISSLLTATGAPGYESCTDGDVRACGCGGAGTQICVGGSWGVCSAGICTPGFTPKPCDDDTNTANGCGLTSACTTGEEICNSSCFCQPTSDVGEPCDADEDMTNGCDPDPNRCSVYLQCDTGTCLCDGAPVILWLSPVDLDGIPNGARRNFVTIGGRYFGAFEAGTSSVYFTSSITGSTTAQAAFPNSVNPACTDNWTDTQIIVVVPDDAVDGPVRVLRGDGQQDDTADAERGVQVNFEVNTTVRPGLCLASPASGVFSDNFTLQGNNFNGASRNVYLGSATASTSADNVNFVSTSTATADIPNIRAGGNTVFVSAGGELSNVLNFTINSDSDNDPFIDYIDPPEGGVGQYVTVYGRNFKAYRSGVSKVQFGSTDADISFPEICQDKWWRDRTIVVKVPSIGTGPYQVSVTNRVPRTSNLVDFSVIDAPPGPGLCLLEPHNGPTGMQTEAYGENFGTTRGAGNAIFYNDVNATNIDPWNDGQVGPLVPVGAETGRFMISDNSANRSNSLNFTVGKCTPAETSTTSPECDSTEDCCAGGNYDGICLESGTCGAGTADACTFAWTFSTDVSTTTPDSCAGFSGAAACVNSNGCPNSPGQCQTSTSTIMGNCGQPYCDTISACGVGGCEFEANRCKLTGSACNQTNPFLIDGYTAECRRVNSIGVWQINTPASCPTSTAMNSYRDANGWCTVGTLGAPEDCQLCPNGLACQGGEDGATGECFTSRNVCPTSAPCDLEPGSPTLNKCIDTSGTCECCCRVDSPEQDCCLGLTCEAGGCGNDPAVYGLCTGCAVIVGGVPDQDLSNAACNCKPGGAARVCDLTDPIIIDGVSRANPTGVCVDTVSEPDEPCNDGGGLCTGGGICAADAYCDTDCLCKDNTDLNCDGDPAPSCQPNDATCAILGTGWECNPSTCRCREIIVEPGIKCQDEGAGICTEGVPSCGGDDYQCLEDPGVDCRCCCDPTIPQYNDAGLRCEPDKTPCSGGARGLYCGCTTDSQCENPPETAGCSPIDTCCRPRPRVIESETRPAPNDSDVCRNPLLSVTFDDEMDIQSFTGKMIVVGDYETGPCPAGTNYLTGGVYKKYNAFSRLWYNLKKYFGGQARAQVPGNNYCAVTGRVKGINTGAGNGVVTFAPSRVLDAGRRYYAIVEGDNFDTASTSEGVKSRFGISMGEQLPATSADFNGVTYHGYIWNFRTKPIDPGPPEDDGICRLEYVTIEPSSYLFQSTIASSTDDGLNNSLDASTVDNDKQFDAYAKSATGQNIAPIADYSWDWNWLSENESVARVIATSSYYNDTPSAALVQAQNKKDAKTYLKVNATIMTDYINTPSTAGRLRSAKAPIYVFICENPWPPVDDPAMWPWQDSDTNCTQETATCLDNNFELYYCRDSASVGTANDLPAILVEPVVRGTTTPSQPLKELFFMRENLPGQASLALSPQPDGTTVYAQWPRVTAATSYKIYYGSASRTYTEVIEVTDLVTYCPVGLDCYYPVTGLVTGRRYYFAVSSIIGASRAESAQSTEAVATPTDTQKPLIPTGFSATPADRAVDLSWNINSSSDIVGYYIYYGATIGSYGSREAVNNSTNQVAITGLTNGVPYYFVVGAYDGAGNEATTSPLSAVPGS
jgi:hypothetical protein